MFLFLRLYYIVLLGNLGWSDQIYLSKKIFKKCSLIVVTVRSIMITSCFIYLSEILSKLQMFKVTNSMTFSDGLLIICHFAYKPYTFNLFLFPPGIITN